MTQSYLRNRYYSPSIGRFITEDPIKDGFNWYAYCHNDSINFRDFNGYTEYYVNGAFPQFILDHTFPYNPNAVATKEDEESWKKWNNMAFYSGFVPWLQDASKAYKHYLENTGTEMKIDYERAYNEDKVIRSIIDDEILKMQTVVKWLYDDQWGTDFRITGEMVSVPNGDSENWQKTIGAHQTFGVGDVIINENTGIATMRVTFYMEDMYNFNPGAADIATGIPDDENGRFSELGWAKEFKTYGSLEKTVTWQLFTPVGATAKKKGNGR